MFSTENVKNIVEEKIKESDKFIVDIKILSNNKILISLDSDENITIGECAEISRFIEAKLNRDNEDFELEVSSPGLNHPFKVFRQYLKNINKDVSVIGYDGIKRTGKLLKADENGIEIEVVKNQTKNKINTEIQNIPYKLIKETKSFIKF
ncbi:MAG: ribosome assembly cofactor RimP [Bacteroidales bacterium]|nr:ribosome assembly cofactor RimP [Bacteroidales bacterium]